jgi:glucan biosynthesis protein C
MPRFYSLDALRAAMMLLGVLLHAACAYSALPDIWWLKDSDTSPIMDRTLIFIHIFRMPIFFLMAGLFTALLVHRRGWVAALRNRARRIGLPLILGVVVFSPILKPMAMYQRFAIRSPRPLEDTWHWFISLRWIPSVEPMHLWFLLYLLFLYCLSPLIAPLADRLSATRPFRRLLEHPLRFVPFALATFLTLLPMQFGLLDTPKSFLPVPRILAAYAVFFFAGWTLFRHHDLLPLLARQAHWNTIAGLTVSWMNVFLTEQLIVPALLRGQTPNPPHPSSHLSIALTGAFAVWLLAFGFTGLCQRYLSAPSHRVRYLSDSAYWVYLAHPVALVPFQLLLWNTPIGWAAKLTFTLLFAVPLLYWSYARLVRSSIIGQLLNGKRYPSPATFAPPPQATVGLLNR